MSASVVEGYELESELGRGASSVVYIARQHALGDRRVALKLIQRADLDDVALRRFERERASLAKLSAVSGVVTVFDAGVTASGWPWISMELMQGGSLADWLRVNGPMGLGVALGVAVTVGAALATAHDQGILHRDVKPENVLLDDRGQPKLADFGIASVADMGATRSSSASLRGFTGTIAHAAPELLNGASPTVRSDIYALGSTVFAMIAGHAPYVRHGEDSILAILRRVAVEPVPRLETYGVPTAVADVIARAIAVEPAERPDSVNTFVQQLLDAAGSTNTATLSTVGLVPSVTAASAARSEAGTGAAPSSHVNDTWSSQTVHQFAPAEPAAPEPASRPRARIIAIAVAATLTIGGTAAAILNNGDGPPPTEAATATTSSPSTTEPAETTAPQTTEAAPAPTTGTGAFNVCPDGQQLNDHDGDGWGACTIPTTTPSPTTTPPATPPPDTEPPALAITSHPANGFADANGYVGLWGTVEPGANVTVDGVPAYVPGDGTWSHATSLGEYASWTFTVVATDPAGNTSTVPVTLGLPPATTAPRPAAPSGGTSSSRPTVSISGPASVVASAGATCQYDYRVSTTGASSWYWVDIYGRRISEYNNLSVARLYFPSAGTFTISVTATSASGTSTTDYHTITASSESFCTFG